MKSLRIFAVLVLVFALLAAAGCSSETGTGDSSENQPENGISDENGSEKGGETASPDVEVKVTPPEGWEEEESDTALVMYMKDTSSFMVTRTKIPGDVDGLDGYLEKAKEKMSSTFSKMEFSTVESLELDGHDSRKFFSTYEMAGVPFKLVIVYVFRDGYIYNLQGCALADDFDALLPEFEQFINSFRFE